MTQRLDEDMQARISALKAEAADRQRQAALFAAGAAELLSRSRNPVAVALVREQERGHKPTRKIPIICSKGHNSTHATVLHVEDDVDEGTPVTPTIIMDVEPGATGSAEAPPLAGGSWNFVCGKCGGRTSIREPKLLDAALAALIRSAENIASN